MQRRVAVLVLRVDIDPISAHLQEQSHALRTAADDGVVERRVAVDAGRVDLLQDGVKAEQPLDARVVAPVGRQVEGGVLVAVSQSQGVLVGFIFLVTNDCLITPKFGHHSSVNITLVLLGQSVYRALLVWKLDSLCYCFA